MAKADKALVARRVDDLLHVLLDGARWWDVLEFVRAREKEQASAWFVADGDNPLSDSQIRRYQQAANKQIDESFERSRKKNIRQHVAQVRNLFARAVTTGDLRTALACRRDLGEMMGLYPPKKLASTTADGQDVEPIKIIQVVKPVTEEERRDASDSTTTPDDTARGSHTGGYPRDDGAPHAGR